ncbi:tryptophan halogenase family protein [Lacimicrobium sp. SS2-24]|uniref:tryptophan halogenase family protein n=1 Tax=Lacimicrobium sp. SS2-24 TaxID=2005569 RepID=UPI000B4B73CF|nr:tryptophan halogenase family protein [Lacimicrobium sp. SS2-24]
MQKSKIRVVVIGGGTAGWLTANLLAADHDTSDNGNLEITLVESPDIKTIGVGEGTWPSMRTTLERIGLSETDLIRECDASFKQGSLFRNWYSTDKHDHYYHPFSLPAGYQQLEFCRFWQQHRQRVDFASAATPQTLLCEKGLAPKQLSTPEFAFILNYGYHLNAAKFVELLTRHGTQRLGIRHIQDKVTDIISPEQGNKQDSPITAIRTQQHGTLEADLFIDCSGFNSLLLGKHYQVPLESLQSVLFNDRAMVMQVPYADDQAPIQSCTMSSAQENGWIWDIGLSTRRGIGYVYASNYESDDDAEQRLRRYVTKEMGEQAAKQSEPRQIQFTSGYRKTFWVHNTVAVGLSAGFIEPLEASALALIENSARFISDNLNGLQQDMAFVSDRFNQRFEYHWKGIVEFLKLHYCLSQRQDSDYWQDNRHGLPESLKHKLALWQRQAPSIYDTPLAEELFPAASYQYVYYGMHGETRFSPQRHEAKQASTAEQLLQENQHKIHRMTKALPSNRALINDIKQQGLRRL